MVKSFVPLSCFDVAQATYKHSCDRTSRRPNGRRLFPHMQPAHITRTSAIHLRNAAKPTVPNRPRPQNYASRWTLIATWRESRFDSGGFLFYFVTANYQFSTHLGPREARRYGSLISRSIPGMPSSESVLPWAASAASTRPRPVLTIGDAAIVGSNNLGSFGKSTCWPVIGIVDVLRDHAADLPGKSLLMPWVRCTARSSPQISVYGERGLRKMDFSAPSLGLPPESGSQSCAIIACAPPATPFELRYQRLRRNEGDFRPTGRQMQLLPGSSDLCLDRIDSLQVDSVSGGESRRWFLT